MRANDIYVAFKERLQSHRPVALATIIQGPDRLGAKLLADGSGHVMGSLGAAGLDAQVLDWLPDLLQSRRSQTREVGDYVVFIEVHPPTPRLLIVGAVHIAVTLSKFARELGFRVVLVDARSSFATPERFPHVDELILGWPDEVLARLHLDEFTYVVVVSHDEKLDNPALIAALSSPAPYVGALGSRKTHERRVKALRAGGVSDQQIARLHAPIGLDIGARTPEEIALAIMAQIVAVHNTEGS